MTAILEKSNSVMEPIMVWNDWKEPSVTKSHTHDVVTEADGNNLIMRVKNEEGKTESFSKMTTPALRELAKRVQFPTDFVSSLPTNLQADIINHKLQSARNQKFSVIADEEGRIIAASPGWRDSVSHREIAQTAYDTLMTVEDVESVNIHTIQRHDESMFLRFTTPVTAPVTRKVDDILKMGVEISHSFGTDITVSLFTERLICTNGMTANRNEYNWMGNGAKTKEEQIEWIKSQVAEVMFHFDVLIAKSRQQAETPLQGDPAAILSQRARSLGMSRFAPQIIEAFNAEPDMTEWGITNALTRFASHNAPPQIGRRLQNEAGNMVMNFVMATARLPLYFAQQNGYEILSSDLTD